MTTRISQIRERAEKATPGPWFNWFVSREENGTNVGDVSTEHNYGYVVCDVKTGDKTEDDRKFLAHARSDIPWLLERLGEAGTIIRDSEWASGDIDDPTCPMCDMRYRKGHNSGCRLAAFLAALAEGEEKDG